MRRRASLVVAVLASAVALAIATGDLPPVATTPPGSFAFAVLGDAPYNLPEVPRYRRVLRDLEAHDLAFVVHVGDIWWEPCTDDQYVTTRDEFNRLAHPVIYTPGDNEWFDCWEREAGGYAPLERLRFIRQTFFVDPAHALGAQRMDVASQHDDLSFPEFVENVRWTYTGIVFATTHIIGSHNGMRPFPGRTPGDDEAARRRTAAAAAWLHATFAEARTTNATAVVIAFHANPGFEDPALPEFRANFEPWMTALEDETARFSGPVVAIHGDGHEYTVDHPLVRRPSREPIGDFTRVQVPGSPAVGWVRVVATPGPRPTFTFAPRVVPRWRLW
jgi:hypothetical protein